MAGTQKRTRSERVAALELPPGMVERTLDSLHRSDVLSRLGLCLVTAVLLWCVTGGWAPPLGYRTGFTPLRDITARVEFSRKDPQATQAAQDKAKRSVHYVYEQDKEPIVQLKAALLNSIVQMMGAKSLDEGSVEKAWKEFFGGERAGVPALTQHELEEHFQLFHEALPNQAALEKLDTAVSEALAPAERYGLMESLPQEHNEGNQQEIIVHPKADANSREIVSVADVLIANAESLRKRLQERVASPEVAARVFDWLRPRLPKKTLTFNRDETQQAKEKAVADVGDVYTHFRPGDVLAPAGKPLNDESLDLLKREHVSLLQNLSTLRRVYYSMATLGMFVALLILCGVYIVHYERGLLIGARRFTTMQALVVVAVGLAMLVSRDNWRAELIPLLLFGMTVAIAHNQELALLLSAGGGAGDRGGHRARAERLHHPGRVGGHGRAAGRPHPQPPQIDLCRAGRGAVALTTTLGVGTVVEQPFETLLHGDAMLFGLWSLVAGFLMTGLLPFIESLFGVLTEISLLELGDVAHPLLQELVRRAPGTYNHSINVASIAEAAAESIGARGLLVRVGAYFHDIGKMLKPGYFVENQGQDANRHESLVPAMSTLIIIAHIKDGADLARQHHLPQPIIDFIEQHHGTTLVEYFYRRASEQSEANDGEEVEESAFRYPGPKPQTKEAAVLMLADAVESASRALVEPTPARIESLVHDIAMKRLLDGQFDCCALTLHELATIEDSLVKSLTAVYHGRVKYPGQRSA